MLTAYEQLPRQSEVKNWKEGWYWTPFSQLGNCDWHQEGTLSWLCDERSVEAASTDEGTYQYQGCELDVYHRSSSRYSFLRQERRPCSARTPLHDPIDQLAQDPCSGTCTSVGLRDVSACFAMIVKLDSLVILKAARSSRSLPSTPLPPNTYMTSSTRVAE